MPLNFPLTFPQSTHRLATVDRCDQVILNRSINPYKEKSWLKIFVQNSQCRWNPKAASISPAVELRRVVYQTPRSPYTATSCAVIYKIKCINCYSLDVTIFWRRSKTTKSPNYLDPLRPQLQEFATNINQTIQISIGLYLPLPDPYTNAVSIAIE